MKDIEFLKILHSSISPTGFEKLVYFLLEKMGFDEVEHLGGSGDHGVDLTAILRKSEIEDIETNTPFKIQVKRYDPENTLNPSIIRELRGSLQSGERGLLVTTGKVSKNSIEDEALKDISRIILVIDGSNLISLLKKYEVGIVKKYTIDESFISNLETADEIEPQNEIISKKLISNNDIKARIIRIPKELKSYFNKNEKIKIKVNNQKSEFTVDKSITYIGGVTELFKKYGLIDNDDNEITNEKFAVWTFKNGEFFIDIENKNEDSEKPNILNILNKVYKTEAKREIGTPYYNLNNNKYLIRYSKMYKGQKYWYGLIETDLEKLKNGDLNKIIFICYNKYIIEVTNKEIISFEEKLNYTDKNGKKQFHLHIQEENKRCYLILKEGSRKELKNIIKIVT
ncbi:MAG: restriction endonuclease [Leptospiraceae bacterium]|nr:restriction endonuclease [Leptospiraceae bacterium]